MSVPSPDKRGWLSLELNNQKEINIGTLNVLHIWYGLRAAQKTIEQLEGTTHQNIGKAVVFYGRRRNQRHECSSGIVLREELVESVNEFITVNERIWQNKIRRKVIQLLHILYSCCI